MTMPSSESSGWGEPRATAVRCIRWLAVVPMAILAWHLSLVVGLALHSSIEALCPADQMISGLCVAPWFPAAETAVFIFCAAFAAALIVTACTLVAPDHRRIVAWTVFALGALVAAYLALMTMAIWEFLAAVSAGSLSAWLLTRTADKA